MKRILLILIALILSGCQKNAQLKAVLNDFESTPRCVVSPVLTNERDTKDLLAAKVVILNDRVACMVHWYYYFDKKIESYRKLN